MQTLSWKKRKNQVPLLCATDVKIPTVGELFIQNITVSLNYVHGNKKTFNWKAVKVKTLLFITPLNSGKNYVACGQHLILLHVLLPEPIPCLNSDMKILEYAAYYDRRTLWD